LIAAAIGSNACLSHDESTTNASTTNFCDEND
jgi:hypothetical protein